MWMSFERHRDRETLMAKPRRRELNCALNFVLLGTLSAVPCTRSSKRSLQKKENSRVGLETEMGKFSIGNLSILHVLELSCHFLPFFFFFLLWISAVASTRTLQKQLLLKTSMALHGLNDSAWRAESDYWRSSKLNIRKTIRYHCRVSSADRESCQWNRISHRAFYGVHGARHTHWTSITPAPMSFVRSSNGQQKMENKCRKQKQSVLKRPKIRFQIYRSLLVGSATQSRRKWPICSNRVVSLASNGHGSVYRETMKCNKNPNRRNFKSISSK